MESDLCKERQRCQSVGGVVRVCHPPAGVSSSVVVVAGGGLVLSFRSPYSPSLAASHRSKSWPDDATAQTKTIGTSLEARQSVKR